MEDFASKSTKWIAGVIYEVTGPSQVCRLIDNIRSRVSVSDDQSEISSDTQGHTQSNTDWAFLAGRDTQQPDGTQQVDPMPPDNPPENTSQDPPPCRRSERVRVPWNLLHNFQASVRECDVLAFKLLSMMSLIPVVLLSADFCSYNC